jgi:hypothetical protein
MLLREPRRLCVMVREMTIPSGTNPETLPRELLNIAKPDDSAAQRTSNAH